MVFRQDMQVFGSTIVNRLAAADKNKHGWVGGVADAEKIVKCRQAENLEF